MHQGVRQTLTSALPKLLALDRRQDVLRGLLGCAHHAHPHPVPEDLRETAELDWSTCPMGLLGGPHVQAIARLDRLAKVAPVDGWPGRFAPWAVFGVLALREARGEAR